MLNSNHKSRIEYLSIPKISILAEEIKNSDGNVTSLIYHFLKGFGWKEDEYGQTEIKDPNLYF
jgi:hypothetical protein